MSSTGPYSRFLRFIETMSIQAVFSRIVAALPEAVRQVYGERLLSLVLFGSVARGTAKPTSDIDLLLVATTLPSGRFDRVSEFEAVEKRLETPLREARLAGVHTVLSPLFKTPGEMAEGSFVFLDMPAEGRILHDPSGYVADYFQRLEQRLQAQGARRIEKNGGHYWLLAPDLPPGTPIPL